MSHATSEQGAVLRSCGILFLFRALQETADRARQAHIETQIADRVADMTGATHGAVQLARSARELKSLAAQALNHFDLSAVTADVAAGNAAIDEQNGIIACPLYRQERIAGMIAARFASGPITRVELEERLDTLIAIATLAGYALSDAAEMIGAAEDEPAISPIEMPGMIGESEAIHKILRMVRRVAPAETTVLIEGESGTGKEVIARALHDLSPRRSKAFVAINCAVLTENLLESELFGHEKGAFTGAIALKKGKVEMAEGGTLFLDEIGEMALGLQAKLLRVLQQREFERVGGTKTLRLDVRVIAATNRDLKTQVKNGGFREDLYHRLNVIAIATPPLRERADDIVPLALHFLERARAKAGREIQGISAEAKRCLLRYQWPGNVRELENVIERAVVLGESRLIEADDLPPGLQQTHAAAAASGDLEQSISSAKRDSILKAWADSNGDYREAALKLGLHPNSLLRLLKKLNLRADLQR